jgi:hypothetical protein
MSMKVLSSTLVVSLFVLVLIGATSWAEDPTSLIVVRASDDSLWKATCDGLTCTAFTSFPGMFASQPTVYWDEKIKRYVLWGRASNNTIWRSTFNHQAVFNNDWTQIPGATASPIGAVGSVEIRPQFNFFAASTVDVSTLADCATGFTNLVNGFINTSRAGYVVATASGIYAPGTAEKFVRVAVSDSSGNDFNGFAPILESTSANFLGYGAEKGFTIKETYTASVPGTQNVYFKACKEAGATGSLMYNDFVLTYHTGVL